jgi:ABC-type multidrug transport system fused ATPase/permease subunit
MTMYVLLFRQGQSAVSSILSAIGGMYEDNLYLSTLYDYLDTPVAAATGTLTAGATPGTGLQFKQVSFTYPGATEPAVRDVSFTLRPGESLALVGENGSGKTTLIKLLTRLYTPDSGRILLDGTNLDDWQPAALRRRVGVIFQDFARYQLKVGENIGAGDVAHFEDEARWREAAGLGMAAPFIEELPGGTRRNSAVVRTAASCRAASGRRSRCHARSCARTPTSSCSTSPRRRWTHAPKRRSSSSSRPSPARAW